MSGNSHPILQICPLCQGQPSFSFRSRDLLYDHSDFYNYACCTNCGCEYQSPMPDKKTIQSFYPDEYMVYQPITKQRHIGQWKKTVLHYRYGYRHLKTPLGYRLLAPLLAKIKYKDSIPYTASGQLLDIGCGNGKFMHNMTALDWQCQGVEFSHPAVQICRTQGLKVFHGDLPSAAFPQAIFDVVTARHVIEHIPDPNAFLQEIARILKPDGYLVIKTPNSQALARKHFGIYWYANDVPRHLVLFSPNNLAQAAARQQLTCCLHATFTSPKILLNSWDYKTGNRDQPSKRKSFRRWFARLYIGLAQLSGRGDEIFGIFRKVGKEQQTFLSKPELRTK